MLPGHLAPWKEVCEQLNQKLHGWRAYFRLGAKSKAYRAVDEYVYDSVRHFLRRRHKVSSQDTRQFPGTGVRAFGGYPTPRADGHASVILL